MTDFFVQIFCIGLITWALTGLMARYAQKLGFVDVPNDRSSHTRIVPRSGGLSIVLTFIGVLIFFYMQGYIEAHWAAALIPGAIAVALAGLFDDYQGLSSRIRILVHLGSAGIALFFLKGMPTLLIGSIPLDLGLFGYLIGVLFITWLLNLYNFMDGIDGIAGVETLTVCFGAALLGLAQAKTVPVLSELLIVLGMSSLGFLLWNWPPAKIFMGDVASGFLGYVLAVFALVCAHEQHVSLWAWLILLGCFIVDSTYTLLRRMSRGERWYTAHRSHTYQRVSRTLASHAKVTIAVGGINVIWLLPLAFLANTHADWGFALVGIAWFPLLLLAIYFKAGMPDEHA
jgi:Fuc2NAc and GlcNAc transferase